MKGDAVPYDGPKRYLLGHQHLNVRTMLLYLARRCPRDGWKLSFSNFFEPPTGLKAATDRSPGQRNLDGQRLLVSLASFVLLEIWTGSWR